MDNLKLTTPTAIASYPWLNVPDTKFASEGEGKYKCNLVFDPSDPEAEKFIAKVEGYAEKARLDLLAHHKKSLEKANPKQAVSIKKLIEQLQDEEKFRSPIEIEYDGDTGEPTGNVFMKTKSNESFKTKKGEVISLAPKFFDADAQLLTDKPIVKGGSKLKLNVTLVPYCSGGTIGNGISVRINAVQIITLATGGSDDNDDFGFGKTDGYVAPAEPTFEEPQPEINTSGDDDEY